MKKRLIAIILLIVTISNVLASCSSYKCEFCKDADPNCEMCSPTTTEECFFTLTKDVNIICRYDGMSFTLGEAVMYMTKAVSTLTGVNTRAKDDNPEDGIGRYEFEILIGNTNRPESKELFDSLSYYDYAYKVISENCVVICGGSDESTLKAVKQFLNDCYEYNGSSDGTLRDVKVGTTFIYTGEYPLRSVLLCDKNIEEYTIVYSGSYSDVHSANFLHSEISRLCNARLPIRSIDEFEGGNAIYIGIDDKGGHLYDDFGENGYVVKATRGDYNTVIIDSTNGIREGALVSSFCRENLQDPNPNKDFNIDLPEGERFFILSSPIFNGLRLQKTHTTTLDSGVICKKLTYTDYNGASVIAYAAIADLSSVTAINATPDYSDITIGVRSTVRDSMKAAKAAGYSVIAGTNGDFFAISSDCHPSGLCIKQGKLLNDANDRPWFGVTKDGAAVIGSPGDYYGKYKDVLVEAIGGSHMILRNGFYYPVDENSEFVYTRHPRTSVGVTADNKLVLLVVDGRQKSYSNGASLVDLAYIMAGLGVTDAINLDGGGSSSFVTYSDKAGYIVQNKPSDGSLRRVYNSLVLVKK